MDPNLRERLKQAKRGEEKWEHWAEGLCAGGTACVLEEHLVGESAYNAWNNKKCGLT